MSTNILFLSLGSNIEPRKSHLQYAIRLLKEQLGSVVSCSSIYETPAWGFDSTSFLNLCIKIETTQNTKATLKATQQIEKQLGRIPKKGDHYEARNIDIDIIYASEGIFNYPQLTVPHPLMHKRNFVLAPLAEIAPTQEHPLLHKTTLKLLEECKDEGKVSII